MAQGKAPWCGVASWLGIAVGWSAGTLAAQAAVVAGGNGMAAGLGVGVLGAALVGCGLAVASRVRGERWPWIGIGGAVLSALPLLMYLLRMMLKL
ncbi:hypothetical protein B9Y76_01650 [Stenotrophomonas maltophilia]|uniref:hypothetical protein n=1 Tax=Stenotrophomonas maltophilia TaxID=40324 RepID=UPI000B4E2665|nr:hypothetical protein [Stenotrophomonas maltophilia]MPS42605.1 hypothetical protein [Stenotrophomonas sp.]MBA0383782.1 hypothetical protein [Stenotrophomonas maltophilia]OWQ82129.1 hypothetical protein CEE62_03900 [Stenotrophomonas maltophilia]PJL04715.1 hypothetical protein B9Y76_01650 [Stenotrophomonas maltophilia]QPX93967.1 hypothetical protein HUZ96_14340 [Stenotrophomonas maltophilia]